MSEFSLELPPHVESQIFAASFREDDPVLLLGANAMGKAITPFSGSYKKLRDLENHVPTIPSSPPDSDFSTGFERSKQALQALDRPLGYAPAGYAWSNTAPSWFTKKEQEYLGGLAFTGVSTRMKRIADLSNCPDITPSMVYGRFLAEIAGATALTRQIASIRHRLAVRDVIKTTVEAGYRLDDLLANVPDVNGVSALPLRRANRLIWSPPVPDAVAIGWPARRSILRTIIPSTERAIIDLISVDPETFCGHPEDAPSDFFRPTLVNNSPQLLSEKLSRHPDEGKRIARAFYGGIPLEQAMPESAERTLAGSPEGQRLEHEGILERFNELSFSHSLVEGITEGATVCIAKGSSEMPLDRQELSELLSTTLNGVVRSFFDQKVSHTRLQGQAPRTARCPNAIVDSILVDKIRGEAGPLTKATIILEPDEALDTALARHRDPGLGSLVITDCLTATIILTRIRKSPHLPPHKARSCSIYMLAPNEEGRRGVITRWSEPMRRAELQSFLDEREIRLQDE